MAECTKTHARRVEEAVRFLHRSQAGPGRHKCACCAWEDGFTEGWLQEEKEQQRKRETERRRVRQILSGVPDDRIQVVNNALAVFQDELSDAHASEPRDEDERIQDLVAAMMRSVGVQGRSRHRRARFEDTT